jgi:phosphoribosylformylglycinamidine (FGAM) synthase-like enzyme
MVLKPGKEPMAEAIFKKWELDFAVIGEVTDTGHMVLTWKGETVCDIPLGPLAEDAPLYDRPALSLEDYKAGPMSRRSGDIPESADLGADLLKLMACPDLASRAGSGSNTTVRLAAIRCKNQRRRCGSGAHPRHTKRRSP